MGTNDTGILAYDPAADAWRTIGPAQGLPDAQVYTLLPLDDGTLFCHGGDNRAHGFSCLVNPSTSEVRLLGRFSHPGGRNPLVDSGLFPVWKVGDRIVGFIGGGELYTLPKLGAGEPMRSKWPGPNASGEYYESLPLGMAVVAGRRFLMCHDTFREINDDGKVLRAWPRANPKRSRAAPASCPARPS